MLAILTSLQATCANAVRFRTRVTVAQQQSPAATRIFCYGDSLTAGTFNMGEPDQLFPYAPHLERALCANGDSFMVRHRGLPGWTAAAMNDNVDDETRGLRGSLRRIKEAAGDDPPVALAIILAGTNDLGCYADAASILEALQGIHLASHACNVPTLAVGIPPSGFMARDEYAAKTAAEVNSSLRDWCASEAMADFEPHPIATFEPSSGLWSSDGLHFSPEGYRVTGEGLAAAVRRRL